MARATDSQELQPISVSDMVRYPWIGFGVFVLFARHLVLGAIAAHLMSSTYGLVLLLIYALAKLGEYIVDERARMFRESEAAAAHVARLPGLFSD